MAEGGQGNQVKIRGGHVGYLKRLYGETELLLNDPCEISALDTKLDKINTQFKSYIAAHDQCFETQQSDALIEDHNIQIQNYTSIKEKIEHRIARLENRSVKSFRSKSRASSSHCSSTSSKRLTDSKVKLELAKLKLKQIEECQNFERQQEELNIQAELEEQERRRKAELEAQEFRRRAELQKQELKRQAVIQNTKHEIERAQLESSVLELETASRQGDDFEERETSEHVEPQSYQQPANVKNVSYLPQSLPPSNVCAAQDSYSSRPNLTAQPSLSPTDVLANILSLPKAELLEFNGEAKNYQSFITNFKSHIDSKLNDPSVKLTYLIQYCTGEAKRLIKNCVLMPSSQGYEAALRLLKEHCGQNHLIARAHIDGLIQGPPVKANDTDGLVKLSREVIDCQIVLSQLSFTSDMDASETIWSIAKRLPNHLHAKWVEQAADILKVREPNYNDICRFIEARARVGATVYGRKYAEMLKSKVTSHKPIITQKGNHLTTLSTQVNSNQDKQGQVKNEFKGSVKSDASSAQNNVDSVNEKCAMCNFTNHKIQKCYKFIKLPIEERLKFVQSTRLCFRCLKSGHFSKDCNSNCTKCQRRHNVLLHDNRGDVAALKKDAIVDDVSTNQVNVNFLQKNEKICLGIIPVKIKGKGASVETYALLDSGSNATLINRELANSLNLQGQSRSFALKTVSGKSTENNQREVNIVVSDQSESSQISVQALTVDDLNIQLSCAARPEDVAKYHHLQGIKLPSIKEGQVGLLIGTNSPEMHWTLEERRGGRGEPVARRTLLGWTIMGPVSQQCNAQDIHINHIKTDIIQQQLDLQWNVDFNDANDFDEQMSRDDKAALKIMQESCKLVKGKFQVAIPWKYDPNKLPNNRNLAEVRLKHLKRKLTNDPKLHEQYTTTVESYVKEGHARELNDEEASDNRPQWYLPHHPVFKRSNPSKCRVVFDCAAKYGGASLNEAIFQGPNFLNNLAGVLMRFRKDSVAVVADIEAMFHQCFVTETDQHFLRFLWWKDGDLSAIPKVYVMKVHLFGAKSSPSVACFCMLKIAEDNESQFSRKSTDALRNSFYMDDLLESTPTVDSATRLITELRELLHCGGFNLTKCMSTHRDVLKEIPNEHRAKSLLNIDIFESILPQELTLGLQWNVEDDFFSYDVQIPDKPLTRRGILSMSASLYDPLGFVSPVSLIPKLMLQTLCKLNLDWDEEIPTDIAQKMLSWKSSLQFLQELKIPRCVKPNNLQYADSNKTQLHIFSDASEKAYGAAAYLKLYTPDNVCTVNLIMGKSRVAPLKAISIPRLELTAATVAARMYKFIKTELNIKLDKVYFWTDSTIVLKYLQNQSTRFLRFVAHRIQVIQDLTDVEDWHYVPSKLNPADIASRGIELGSGENLSVWLNGPNFLRESHDYSYVLNISQPIPELELEEKKVFVSEAIQFQTTENYIESFSSFYKLCKCVAWLLKFVKYLQLKVKQSKLKNDKDLISLTKKCLQPNDIEEAERSILRFTHGQEFKLEIRAIEKSQPLHSSSVLMPLNPVLQDGILTVGGRLQFSPSDVNKHPIILPSSNHVTNLVIRQAHERNGHVGVNHCLSYIGEKYYIIKAYSNTKRVVSNCFTCKRQHGVPCRQLMAPLPKERTSVEDPPFTHVGVDFFGPMSVKFGRGTTKRYGCLFTCLTIRAVHIEITHSLESDAFLMAFHRFQARRGKPSSMWSDCGTNFVAADKELQRAFTQLKGNHTQNALLMEAIEWNFIPPHAPHMGGVWERMVKSVKTVLKTLVGQRLLSDEELLSFMCEVEKILNDRPLTKFSSDPRDELPLTPSHLLLLKGNSCAPLHGQNYVKRRWEVIQTIANRFYSRFVKEYIPTLQTRNKWENVHEEIKVNDIVLVIDETLPRGNWPLGLVCDVNIGRDGLVRSARVRVKNSLKVRPITKLVLLEHSN